MTYNVFGGTLNLTLSVSHVLIFTSCNFMPTVWSVIFTLGNSVLNFQDLHFHPQDFDGLSLKDPASLTSILWS